MTRWRTIRGTARGAHDDVTIDILVLPPAVVEIMRTECERKAPLETGGVLVGYVGGDRRTIVTAVVGPGPSALHMRTRFQRDGDYAQAEVDRLHHASAGRDDYVGEWHSHPEAGGPSMVDRGSMSWISDNPRYGRHEPVLIIMERVGGGEWRVNAYRWVERRLVALSTSSGSDAPST